MSKVLYYKSLYYMSYTPASQPVLFGITLLVLSPE